ncbi:hypothetical protein [Streptomyces sp. NPDC059009]|uniref:hypothetical protein n=1 Tax=Streptomyces sp. NPDC059009 TaxID=3346694 RepID=UPI0036B0B321
MSTKRRHSLVRTAALTTVVSGALLIPATAAFADSPSTEPTTQTQTPQPDKDKGTDKGTDHDKGTDKKTDDPSGKKQDKGDKDKDKGGNKWGPVYEVTLGNGAKAKIQNRGGAYVATIIVGGKNIATLSSTHPTITYNGVKYEVYPSNGHVGITYLNGKKDQGGKGHKKDQNKVTPQDRKGEKTVTPKGGVKAGAEGVSESGDPAFLVAGGGMAAAGAAGLGFAMLRRGRSES